MFDVYYYKNVFLVKVTHVSASQMTSQLKLCPGNNTRHKNTNQSVSANPNVSPQINNILHAEVFSSTKHQINQCSSNTTFRPPWQLLLLVLYCHRWCYICCYFTALIFVPPPLSDIANVIRACYGDTAPPIILIGHGVGGAIAVHTTSNMLLPSTVGLVAIDVVEGKDVFLKASLDILIYIIIYIYFSYSFVPAGSAMDALHSIQNFLKGRPKSFKSMDHAIEWRWAF